MLTHGGESLFLRKLVLGIPAQASGKNLTRPLMPPAAPIRPRHLVPTQQGVGTLAPNDLTPCRMAFLFCLHLRYRSDYDKTIGPTAIAD